MYQLWEDLLYLSSIVCVCVCPNSGAKSAMHNDEAVGLYDSNTKRPCCPAFCIFIVVSIAS